MVNNEFVKLVIENPDLPVYCWVSSDVVCDDSYSNWLGEIRRCYLAEIVKHKYSCEYEERIFEKGDVEDLEEYLLDNEPFSEMSDSEVNKSVSQYINELNWKKVILVYIDTPDNIG